MAESEHRPLLAAGAAANGSPAGKGEPLLSASVALEVEQRRGPGGALGAPPGAPAAPISHRERLYMVSIFCCTAALLYADQNLMAPNLTAIAADFGFDAEQRDRYLGGYVAAAFYIVGAPAALLFGYLSDTCNRRDLLFWAVLLGEGPCLLTAFVTRYWQLLVLRLLTGISLGGAFPLVFSLLSDMYAPDARAGVSALVQIATGLGLALGQGVAGFVGPALGWRWPFVVVSAPAIAAACAMRATTREPGRGLSEAVLRERWQDDAGFVYAERISWRKARRLVRIPTNAMVIAQGLFGCLPWGMLLTFLNDFLSQDRGLSVQAATAVVLAVGLGGAAGVVGGGLASQWLYNRRRAWMPLFLGASVAAACAPLYYLVNADVAGALPAAFAAALAAGALGSTVGPGMRAMMMNVNEPETRGVALALQTMLDDLGKGLGPAAVAAIIGRVGRQAAFNIAAAGWLPCGALLAATSLTLERDEAAMQARLKHTVSRHVLSSSAADDDGGGGGGVDLHDGGGGAGEPPEAPHPGLVVKAGTPPPSPDLQRRRSGGDAAWGGEF